MPWLETSPLKEREQFIAAVLSRELPFAEVCGRFGYPQERLHVAAPLSRRGRR
jgi:hypothetical protein